MDTETNVDVSPVDLTFAAFLLPPLIALINQKHWSKPVKGLVAMAVCLAYSLLVMVIRDTVDWSDWRNAIIQVTAATFAAYQWWWGPSNIAPRIESATTITRPPDSAEPEAPAEEPTTPEA